MNMSSSPATAIEPPAFGRSTAPERQKRERRRARIKVFRRATGVGALAVVLVLAVLALRPQPVPVDVARVELGPLEVTIEESGKTRVKDRYVVSATVAGQLSRVWLQPGDAVKEGDTLAEIAPSFAPLIDERARAEAQARVGAALSSLGQAQTRRGRAATAREQAQRDLERIRALAAAGAVSPQELENAEFALRLHDDEVTSAQFAARVAEEEVRLLGERGAAGLERHVDVLAPASGRVLRVARESAGRVEAGTALMEVGDPALLEGVVDLLTTDAVQVQVGMPVSIVGWGGPRDVNARVKRVEPSGFTRLSALGVEEQRVNVILAFSDPAEAWAALGDGYHIEARLTLWRGERVVKVPLLAVFRHGGGSAVFRLDGDTARLVPITLGHRGTLDVEVTSGLGPGERVVVHPGDKVREGVRVEVLN
jgi:HlyD family secretion protein